MRWTGWVAVVAGLAVVAGCGFGYRSIGVQARFSAASRPDPSYFCYDCHGYRYFDPYYDFCDGEGFRYRWADHPRSLIVYRDRYVRIKSAHPDYGRYRYRRNYRSDEKYRSPRDYETWRSREKAERPPEAAPGEAKERRKQGGRDPERKQKDQGDRRKGPRDGASRPTLPGGTT